MKKIMLLILIIPILIILNQLTMVSPKEQKENLEIATLAGGCFWCIEASYEDLEGVHKAISGYTGGEEKNPTYKEVSSGLTGHKEAVQIKFDPNIISYKEILDLFWRQIDPLDDEGQFSDKGPQYRTAIFYHNEEQRKIAEESKKEIQKKFEKKVVTEILEAKEFYQAEDYHQDYSQKKSIPYKLYKLGSGRESKLDELWD